MALPIAPRLTHSRGSTAPRNRPMTNKRHDIDPEQVQATIARQVAYLEQRRDELSEQAREALAAYESTPIEQRGRHWVSQPDTPEAIAQRFAGYIERERAYYAAVRVIELTGGGFVLVYGDADDSTVRDGTGPFDTFEKAASWFLTSGR